MAGFSGGDKLKKALEEKLKQLSKPRTLRAGFLETAKYPDGMPVAQVAYWNDTGTKTAPPRPFFRSAVAAKKGEWADMLKLSFRKDMDIEKALAVTGQRIKDDIIKSIVDFDSPALSPVTVMLRGMRYNDPQLVVSGATVGEAAKRVAEGKTNYGAPNKPLIDSGIMQRSVDFEIKKG